MTAEREVWRESSIIDFLNHLGRRGYGVRSVRADSTVSPCRLISFRNANRARRALDFPSKLCIVRAGTPSYIFSLYFSISLEKKNPDRNRLINGRLGQVGDYAELEQFLPITKFQPAGRR